MTWRDEPTDEELKLPPGTHMIALPADPPVTQTPAKGLTRTQQIQQDLVKMKAKLERMLPEHIPVDKFIQVVMSAVYANPKIVEGDKEAFFKACLDAAEDGLMPNGKEAALVPYKGKAKYTPMVWGIVKKIRQSGILKSIDAQEVFEKDVFKYWVDENGAHLLHEPEIFGERGKRKGAYAIALTLEGGTYIEVMNEKQIQDVREASPGAKYDSPWKGPFEGEMVRKTVIRRMSKRMPVSTDVERVIQRDDDMYDLRREKPTEAGLAGELNGGEGGQQDLSGDRIASLRDLREDRSGQVPHQDQGGEPDRRGVEPSADVQEASPGAASPIVEAVPREVPAGKARDRGQGLGSQRASVRGQGPAHASKVERAP